MPASSIIVNGRTTRRPNVYSQIDASSMQTSAAGAYSLVLIGDGIGGKPASAFEAGELPFLSATSPDEVSSIFSGGDLRAAGLLAFQASNDPKVPNAPARVLFYKTNNSTRAGLSLNGVNASGLTSVMDVQSIDYSSAANQIGVAVMDGASAGTLKVVVSSPRGEETFDNIGIEPALRIVADAGAPFGTLEIKSDATALFARALIEVDADDFKPNLANTALNIIAISQLQTLSVELFGLDSAGAAASETLGFSVGGSPSASPSVVSKLTGVKVHGEFKGSLTFRDASNAIILSLVGSLQEFLPSTGSRVTFDGASLGTATVIGKLLDGSTLQEEIDLENATQTLATFTSLSSVEFSVAQPDPVSLIASSNSDLITTIAAGVTSWGAGRSYGILDLSEQVFESGNITMTLSAPAASAGKIVLRGGVLGANFTEIIDIAIGDQQLTSTTSFDTIEQAELMLFSESAGSLPNVTFGFNHFRLAYSAGDTLADLVLRLSALDGLTASTPRDNANTIEIGLLDYASMALSAGATADLFAFNYDMEQALASSQLVAFSSLERVKPNKRSASLLSGGSDYGVGQTSSSAADFLGAYSALQDLKNVIIVPLSDEESVHLGLVQHCRHMEGIGRDERNGFVGLPLTLTKDELKARIRSLNNRNVSAVAQGISAYNELGELVSLAPRMLAVVAASMQAGSAIGMPLTNKLLNVQDIRQHFSWSPSRSAEEMIEMGLMLVRFDQERGFVWERSITTSRENNAAFTELSTNESVNVSTKTARRAVENRIGDRLFAGLAGVIKSLIAAELQRQIESGIIKSFNAASIVVKDIGDGFDVSYEIAPLEPVNFIRITAHIKRSPVSA